MREGGRKGAGEAGREGEGTRERTRGSIGKEEKGDRGGRERGGTGVRHLALGGRERGLGESIAYVQTKYLGKTISNCYNFPGN